MAQHTGLSHTQARISHRSRDISSLLDHSVSLQEAGLHNDASLDISARLRGGAPKKRCAYMALKQQPNATASTSAAAIVATPSSDPAVAAPDTANAESAPVDGEAGLSQPTPTASTDAATAAAPISASAPTEPVYERCSSAALRMVGDCPRCDKSHCSAHRLPENHNCPALAGFRKKAFDENRAKLEKEATHVSKISAF